MDDQTDWPTISSHPMKYYNFLKWLLDNLIFGEYDFNRILFVVVRLYDIECERHA